MNNKLKILILKCFDYIVSIIAPENIVIQKIMSLDQYSMFQLLPKCKNKYINREKGACALFDYSNKIVKNIVSFIKYKNHPGLKKRIASYLHDEIIELIADINTFQKQECIVLPMPMSKKELQNRGFNQCIEICEEISKLSQNNIKISLDVLNKKRETKRQVHLSKKEREENLYNSMEAVENRIKNKIAIIVDDVYTTGSTYREAKRALMSAGATKVFGIFIAH
jgi:ComF family protein